MADGSTKVITAGGSQIFLIGLIHGHHDDKSGFEWINVGIAEVTPAERILEVLNRPELEEMRMKSVEEREQGQVATMDFAQEERTQTTAKGLAIPIPDKESVTNVFKKATRKRPKK